MAGHETRMRVNRKSCMLLVEKPERKRPLEGKDVGGCIILKGILER
jgi:hypothetical protein